MSDGGLRFTKDEMNELINALEEAVYLLNPTEEDMQKKAGVYRVVTARNVLCKTLEDADTDRLRAKKKQIYEDLKDAVDREWVGLTRDEFKLATEECLNEEDYWEAIESKLKEKNT